MTANAIKFAAIMEFKPVGAGKVRRETDGLSDSVSRGEKRWAAYRKRLLKVSAAVAGLAAASASLMAGFSDVVRIGSQFETLRTQLATVVGSSAEAAFDRILDFAKSTPFQVSQITESFIRLKAVGVEPTMELLESAGDIAAANGRDILQFAEAITGAVTGEMERLKAFGIVARQQGDEVTFVFKGTETRVKKNSEEIVQALLNIGKVNFSGGMARQAETLAGRVSNLEDAWDAAASAIFDAGLDDLLKSSAARATEFVTAITPLASGLAAAAAGGVDDLSKSVGLFLGVTRDLSRVSGVENITQDLVRLAAQGTGVARVAQDLLLLRKGLADTAGAADRVRAQGGPFGWLKSELFAQLPQLGQLLSVLGSNTSSYAEASLAASEAGAIQLKQVERFNGELPTYSREVETLQQKIAALEDPIERAEKAAEAYAAALKKAAEGGREAGQVSEELRFILESLGSIEFIAVGETASEGAFEEVFAAAELARERASILAEIETRYEAQARIQREVNELAEEHNLSAELHARLLEERLGLATEIGEEIGKWDKALDGVQRVATALSDNFGGILGQIGQIVGGLADAVQQYRQIKAEGGTTNQAVGAGVSAGLGVLQNSGILGSSGSTIASYASAGAQLGGGWGALIGAFVGWGVDTMTHTNQTFADGSAQLGRLVPQFEAGTSDLISQSNRIARAISDAVNGLLDAIGGDIGFDGSGFAVQLRDTAEGIKVWAGGVMRSFGDNVQAALDYAVTQIFKYGDISASPIVSAAIDKFRGSTVAELQEVLAAAVTIENMGLDQVEVQLKAKMAAFNKALKVAVFDIGVGAENVLSGPGGIVATFQSAYDQIFGAEDDIAGRVRSQAKAIEASILAERARLLAMTASIRGLTAESEARLTGAKVTAEIVKIIGVSAVTAAEALAAIDTAVTALDSFDFSEGAIREAIRRAESAAGRGGGDGGAASRAATRETYAQELELAMLRASGAAEAVIAAREFEISLQDLEQRMRENGVAASQVEARLAVERELRIQGIVAEYQALIDVNSAQSEWAARAGEISQRSREAIQALGPFSTTVDGLRGPTEELNTILQGTRAELEALGRDALGSLGSQTLAAREDAAQTAATIAFLTKNVRLLGLTAADVEQAVGEIQFNNFASAMDQLVGFLRLADLSTEDRTRATEALIALEKIKFQVELVALREQIRIQAAAGLLTEQQQASLAAALALVDSNMESILEGIASGVDDFGGQVAAAGQSFASTVTSTLSGFASGSQADGAFQLLQELAALQNSSSDLSPIQQAIAPLDDLLARFTELAAFLPAFGTNIEEVTAQINELKEARIQELFDQQLTGLQDILDNLRGGELSGLSDRARFDQLLPEVQQLMRDAQSGDAEVRLNALTELNSILPQLLQLGPNALGSGFSAFAALLAGDLELLGLNGGGPLGTGTGGDGGPIRDQADILGGAVQFFRTPDSEAATEVRELRREVRDLSAKLAGSAEGASLERRAQIRRLGDIAAEEEKMTRVLEDAAERGALSPTREDAA